MRLRRIKRTWRHRRRGDISSALEAQRAYVKRLSTRAPTGLMVPEAFVRGIRDIGYRSNSDAIAELIDNALQALASRVDVVFGYAGAKSNKKPSQLAVVDNGHGLDPAMMRLAVMWGGTHRENDRSGLGRYGYGLPCASVSLGRRFSVYSSVAGSPLYAITIDLDQLTSGQHSNDRGEIEIPPAQPAELPAFVAEHIASICQDSWSGTVILIEKLDRLERSTTLGLREKLCQRFGVTYHKLRDDAALFVDGVSIKPIDPLFLTKEHYLHDLDSDRAQALDPVHVAVRDPQTGREQGELILRYAWLPPSFGSIDKSRDAVGLNANLRFAILKNYHGIIFSRNGRLVDVHTRTPWTTFINNDRYIKVEVEFTASLDEAFGVTTSKQQVTVKPFIWDLLREAGVPKAIEQLRAKVREAKLERRTIPVTPATGEHTLSARSMSALSAKAAGEHQYDFGLALAQYRLCIEARPGEPFFHFEREAGASSLHLNSTHRFYEMFYGAAGTSLDVRAALEILLFCFGDAFLDDTRRLAVTCDQQIASWSRRLDKALTAMASHIASPEPAIADQDTST